MWWPAIDVSLVSLGFTLDCLVPCEDPNSRLLLLYQAKIFLIFQHDGKPPLRGAICDIWEPTRRESPRYTDLWHSTNEARREGAVLLEVGVIAKQAYLQVPQSYDPDVARNLGLRPGDIYFASCSGRLRY